MSRLLERRIAGITTTNTFLRLSRRRRYQLVINATVAKTLDDLSMGDRAIVERAEKEFLARTVNIYLDIDGVLLNNKTNKAPIGINYFLKTVSKFMADGNDIYWLTTHCNGDVSTAVKYLDPYLKNPLSKMIITSIKPTSWAAVKTQGIDFTKPFLWLDDTPLGWADKEAMKKHGVLDSLVAVDVNKQPLALFFIALKLRRMITSVADKVGAK